MVGIGFFAPLPLALMMPFMAGQSMMMGDAFGKAYQYGKRKISAMSNEEFNQMSIGKLGQEILTDYTAIIPSMTQAIKQSTEFQSFIIHELAEIIRNLPQDIIAGFGLQPTSQTPASVITSPTAPPNIIKQQDVIDAILKFLPSLPEAGAVHPEPTITPPTTTTGPTIIPSDFIGPIQPGQIKQGDLPSGIYNGQNIDNRKPPPKQNASDALNDMISSAFTSTRNPDAVTLRIPRRKKSRSSDLQLKGYYSSVTKWAKALTMWHGVWSRSKKANAADHPKHLKQVTYNLRELTKVYQIITNHLYLYR